MRRSSKVKLAWCFAAAGPGLVAAITHDPELSFGAWLLWVLWGWDLQDRYAEWRD